MQTNTRRVQVGNVVADIPVEVYGRILTEAEWTVKRRMLADALAAVDDLDADAWLESWWAEHAPDGRERPADLIRLDAAGILAEWDKFEARQRARLRLPARGES